ncbi:MAG: hypothetical protein HQM08_06495 [Candidatus Riflebacteria bacterium]|nr:hypothetical protein [Candidatus Riflebacteria bacterium]
MIKKVVNTIKSVIRGFKKISRGFTLIEAMVMILLASACMVPIIGTFQKGIDRTTLTENQFRMKTIAESQMNQAIASFSYLNEDLSSLTYTIATFSWPDASNTIATYFVTFAPDTGISIASLPGGLSGDNYSGSQPTNLTQMKVTVSLENDDPTSATESLYLSTLLYQRILLDQPLTAVSGNKLYIADPMGLNFYGLTVKPPYASQTFTLRPLPNPSKGTNDSSQDVGRPGNFAVHPNGKWIAFQCKTVLKLLCIDSSSTNFGKFFQIYQAPGSDTFLSNPSTPTSIRTDRGVAFRSDGQYLYVTSTTNKNLYVLNVPAVLPASFTLSNTISFGQSNCDCMNLGDDGYLYLSDYSTNFLYRLNTYINSALENYPPSGGTVPGLAAATSRDGRYVAGVWKSAWVTWGPSNNPSSYTSSQITAPGGGGAPTNDDCRDIRVSNDSKYAFLTSNNVTANSQRFYSVQLPMYGATFDPNFQQAYPGSGKTTDQLMISPYFKDILVNTNTSQKYVYLCDVASLNQGVYVASFPASRKINYTSAALIPGCIAARIPEQIIVGCSDIPTGDVNNSIEFVDLYAQGIIASNEIKIASQSGGYNQTPDCVALNSGGDMALYGFANSAGTHFRLIDVSLATTTTDYVFAGTASAAQCTFTLDGGWIISTKGSPTFGQNFYKYYGPDGSLRQTETLATSQAVIDMIPMNEGGAMVLIEDSTRSLVDLHWIGTSTRTCGWNTTTATTTTEWVWARWSSRYDDFLNFGVKKLAISPDDSLLALYDQNGTDASSDIIRFFDLRSINFGKYTQIPGLISDLREDKVTGSNFFAWVPEDQRIQAGGAVLSQSFSINDAFSYCRAYPGNFHLSSPSLPYRFAGSSNKCATRFFGYFLDDSSTRFAAGRDDGVRWIFDGGPITAVNWGATGLSVGPAYSIPTTPPVKLSLQLEHAQADTTTGMGFFYSFIPGATVTGGGYTAGTGFTLLTPAGSWILLPASATRALDNPPRFLAEFDTPTTPTGDKLRIAFSRDIASPTLYAFDTQNSDLYVIPFGAPATSYDFTATFSANAISEIGVSPDGQRLILMNYGQSRLNMIDISTPQTASFAQIVSTINLPSTPLAMGMRSFNRFYSKRNVIEKVAVLPTNVFGNQTSTVASGGILINGTDGASGAATATFLAFNPLLNTVTNPTITLPIAANLNSIVGYGTGPISLNGNLINGTDMYVADYGNASVRKVTDDGNVVTVGMSKSGAQFNYPLGMALDSSGNMYVVDYAYNKIKKITKAGYAYTFAGSGAAASTDGKGQAAQFNGPQSIAIDSAGNLYLAEYIASGPNGKVRKIAPDGTVTTFASGLTHPWGITVDSSGNVFVSSFDNHIIQKITPSGTVSTFAGVVGPPGSTDGPGASAKFNCPAGLSIDSSNNVYVADNGNHEIRKITPAGVVTTVAGLSGSPAETDGIGNFTARFNCPMGVAADSKGNLFVADFLGQNIRRILPNGIVVTIAGSNAGFTGTVATGTSDNAVGSGALFNYPMGIAVDNNGTVYVAERDGHRIRSLYPTNYDNPAETMVYTYAGTGSAGSTNSNNPRSASFNLPRQICIDDSYNLLIADVNNYVIRQIDPLGTVTTFSGVMGSSVYQNTSPAQYKGPTGICGNTTGNYFVCDQSSNAIRKISGGTVTTLAGPIPPSTTANDTDGTGSGATFNGPSKIVMDSSNNLFISETSGHVIRKVTQAGVTTILAGHASTPGTTDGTGTAAQFNAPFGLAVDNSGNIIVADQNNNRIRKVTNPAGVVTTITGSTANMTDGALGTAQFNGPCGVEVDAFGDYYVADRVNNRIRKVSLRTGQVWTIAGSATAGSTDGLGTSATFNQPSCITFDNSYNLWATTIIDHELRLVTPLYRASTFAGDGNSGLRDGPRKAVTLGNPTFMTSDKSGYIYASDETQKQIFQISPSGIITPFAGIQGTSGTNDGNLSTAMFTNPRGLAFDSVGNLFVADNYAIRKITPSGIVTTFAGNITSPGDTLGLQLNARFNALQGLAIDASDNIYVGDMNNNQVKKIDQAGNVTSFASNYYPVGLAFDANGNLYYSAGLSYHKIYIVPSGGGAGTVFAGTGTAGSADGARLSATFNNPKGLFFDSAGNLFVVSSSGNNIRKIDIAGNVTTISGITVAGNIDGPGGIAQFNSPCGICGIKSFTSSTLVQGLAKPNYWPTTSDQPAEEIGSSRQAACLTPYGIMIDGGLSSTSAPLSRCQVYWPSCFAKETSAWGLSRDLPSESACFDQALVWSNGLAYRLGGRTSAGSFVPVTTIATFSADANPWSSSTAISSALQRCVQGACTFGDEIFEFGGYDSTGVATSGVIAWNPALGKVRAPPVIPSATRMSGGSETAASARPVGVCAVPCGPFIYLIGGATTGNSSGDAGCCIFRYVP